MKVTIICDGNRTKVVNAFTGEEIDNVTRVIFVHELGKPSKLTLDVLVPAADLIDVDGVFTKHHGKD